VAFLHSGRVHALAILQRCFQFPASDLHTAYEFLQDLFQYEFVFDQRRPRRTPSAIGLKEFIEDAVLIPHPSLPDTYNVTAAGFRKLRLFADVLEDLPGILLRWCSAIAGMALARRGDPKEHIRKSLLSEAHAQAPGNHAREALSKVSFEKRPGVLRQPGNQGPSDREAMANSAAAPSRTPCVI